MATVAAYAFVVVEMKPQLYPKPSPLNRVFKLSLIVHDDASCVDCYRMSPVVHSPLEVATTTITPLGHHYNTTITPL
jgi:hypothetical protein